jgi:phage terminase large subunit GpA-like protein
MKMFSKERLAPMVRETPVLAGKIANARTRDSGNTIATKKFPGGLIAMVGSNSPSGLASRPIRIMVADEVDRFEASAGTEGDPLRLAKKRTTTFWNRVLLYVSTPGDKYNPTEKTGSRIEREFLNGDQRHYHAKCPHCGEHQKMKWANVHWETDDEGNHDPETARYICEHNGCVWDERDRKIALSEEGGAKWIADKPFNGHVSYCLSQLHSLFAPLADGVRDFLESKDDPAEHKTWVNTFLGETWEDKGERLQWSDLKDQRADYNTTDDIPDGVVMITAAADVQGDRLEYEILGWGEDEQSWSLDYQAIYGDLSTDEPWNALGRVLKRTFIHPRFGEMAIRSSCVDSGGGYTQTVYNFCEFRPRVVAIKGMPGWGKPTVGKPLTNTLNDARVFPLGVDNIKELVTQRLKVGDPDKSGYCAFPMRYDDNYFRQLTAEELKVVFSRGRKRREWKQIRKRNEAFDLRVYNTAALEMTGVDLKSLRRRLLRQARLRDNPQPKRKPKPTNKQSNWAHDWKED